MGTRSITKVFDETGACYAAIYRQHDGYPAGHGADIKRLMCHKVIKNGFAPGDKAADVCNGVGCFAAQLVAGLKGEVHGGNPGGVYMTTAGAEPEEFNYSLRVVGSTVYMVVTDSSANELYSGLLSNFSPEKCKDFDGE